MEQPDISLEETLRQFQALPRRDREAIIRKLSKTEWLQIKSLQHRNRLDKPSKKKREPSKKSAKPSDLKAASPWLRKRLIETHQQKRCEITHATQEVLRSIIEEDAPENAVRADAKTVEKVEAS